MDIRDIDMNIVAIRLRNTYQTSYVDNGHLFLKQQTMAVVETEHGIDIGRIIKSDQYRSDSSIKSEGKVLRMASEEDIEQITELEELEEKAFKVCNEKADAKKLAMKLVSVKALFDRTKLIFYFVAESRIDFRELVRELASVFRTRIEMRQIGVRDEARLVGGYGPCGLPLCCLRHKDGFEPVSIKMAKEQSLNLNSMKISGMCGRLLCCLSYEYETYRQMNRGLPRHGAEILINNLKYNVLSNDTLKETVQIRYGDRYINISKYDLKPEKKSFRLKPEGIEKIKNSLDEDSSDDHEEDDFITYPGGRH